MENEYIASVWVEIIISKRVSTLISSYYRQWSLPKELELDGTNSQNSQRDRFLIFTNQISKASKEGKDLVILTDDNIDSL